MDGRPGPKAAGVAKREVSYGPKSGPEAGSRASSPGEQAAACDYRKKLVSWAKRRRLPGKPLPVFEQAADVGELADVLGTVVDHTDQAHANGYGRIPAGVDHAVHGLARDGFEVLERPPVDGRVVVHKDLRRLRPDARYLVG